MKVNYEDRFLVALSRIVRYDSPAKIRRHAERLYGLSPDEALEMAYENVIGEARFALKGYRRKPKPKAAPLVEEQP